ncbi:MAG: hypothetical protein VXZ40_04145 [Nanoarchaeota archaeon]|nr:hypothetical protein [Nanoarchaeota archaeon]
MSLLDTILGRENKNKGLTKNQIKLIDILRQLRQLLTTISFHFPKEQEKLEKLPEENKMEILPLIKEYNSHLRTAMPVLAHLDNALGNQLKDLNLQENIAYLSINQNSKQSTYSRIEQNHQFIHNLIQETKKRYLFENTHQKPTSTIIPESEIERRRKEKSQKQQEYKKAA